jgi:hypothetical protein
MLRQGFFGVNKAFKFKIEGSKPICLKIDSLLEDGVACFMSLEVFIYRFSARKFLCVPLLNVLPVNPLLRIEYLASKPCC